MYIRKKISSRNISASFTQAATSFTQAATSVLLQKKMHEIFDCTIKNWLHQHNLVRSQETIFQYGELLPLAHYFVYSS
jgi:hypothetical protein